MLFARGRGREVEVLGERGVLDHERLIMQVFAEPPLAIPRGRQHLPARNSGSGEDARFKQDVGRLPLRCAVVGKLVHPGARLARWKFAAGGNRVQVAVDLAEIAVV